MATTAAPWTVQDTHDPAAAGALEVRWLDLSSRELMASTTAANLAAGSVTIALANVTADAPADQEREYYWATRCVYFEAPANATAQTVTVSGTLNGSAKSVPLTIRVDASGVALTNFGEFDTVTGVASSGSIGQDGCRLISGMVRVDDYRFLRVPTGGSVTAAFKLTRPSSGAPEDNHGTLASLAAGVYRMGITEISAAPTDAEVWL